MSFGTSAADLLFTIRADSAPAIKEMKSFKSAMASEINSIVRSLPGGNALSQFSSHISNVARIAKADFSTIAEGGSSVGTALSAIAGPAAIGIGAIAAVGTAAVVTAAFLYRLAASSAEGAARFVDLSDKTAFTVESLSALDFALQKGGSNIEQGANGLVKFTNNLAAAEAGSKKFRATFSKMGITDFSNNEKAFSQFLEYFSKLRSDQDKTEVASAVFGQKMGANFASAFKSIGGNFDEFKKKLAESGELLTTETAKNADALDDMRVEVERQLGAIERQFVAELYPTVTQTLTDLSAWLKNNQGDVKWWAEKTRDAVRSVIDAFLFLKDLSSYNVAGDYGIGAGIKLGTRIAATQVKDSITQKDIYLPGMDESGRYKTTEYKPEGTGKGGGSSAADKARQERIRQLEQETKGIEREYKNRTAALKRAYDLDLTSLRDYTAQLITAEEERFKKLEINLKKEKALAKKPSEQKKYDEEIAKAKDERDANIQRATDEQNKREEDSLKQHRENLLKLGEAYDQQMIESARAAAEIRGSGYEEAEQKVLEIQTAAFNRRLEILAEDEKAAANNVEKFRAINDEVARIEQAQVAVQEEAARRIEAARQKDIDHTLKYLDELYKAEKQYHTTARDLERERLDRAERQAELLGRSRVKIIARRAELDLEEEDERHRAIDKEISDQEADLKRLAENEAEKLLIEQTYNALREQEAQRHSDAQDEIMRKGNKEAGREGLLGPLKEEINNIPNLSPIQAAGQAIVTTFRNMKGAILDSISAYVMYGKSVGQIMRQAVAQSIAAIAQLAAVQGIKQTAEALAALASWDLRAAALHGASAAAWFSIALGSAWVGRKVAGDSFTGAGSSYSPTATANNALGNNPSSRDSELPVIDQSRTGGQSRPLPPQESKIHVQLHLTSDHEQQAKVVGAYLESSDGRRQVVHTITTEYDNHNPRIDAMMDHAVVNRG